MAMNVRLATALVAVVLGALTYHGCTVRTLQQRAAASALARDSALAAADTARTVSARALAALQASYGDQVKAVERRVIQERQRADQLDRALGRERLARLQTSATVAALRTELAAAVRADTADTRSATWALRQAPYTVQAEAALPPPPATGRLTLAITLDTLPLELRLGCGRAGPDGMRPATVTAIGPTWATLRLGQVAQAPELCRSPALAPRGPSRAKWAALGAGAMWLVLELLR